jgi:uncharacterized repeat protein (TIGR03833 family)
MLDGKRRDDVQPGTIVKVSQDHKQHTEKLIQGMVKEVLTSSSVHPHGIKVLLENGTVGRVKEIIGKNPQDEKNGLNNLSSLLSKNEDQTTEFKATFRFDMKRYQKTGVKSCSKDVEKSISKTVAAFMNAHGGTLYIGVDDNGGISGLTNDYDTLENKNSDKFRLTLKNSLQSYLKDKIIFEHVAIDFPLIDGVEICKLSVSPSSIPIFIHDNGKEECYVRVDNESKPYDYKEFFEYWNRHLNRKARWLGQG